MRTPRDIVPREEAHEYLHAIWEELVGLRKDVASLRDAMAPVPLEPILQEATPRPETAPPAAVVPPSGRGAPRAKRPAARKKKAT